MRNTTAPRKKPRCHRAGDVEVQIVMLAVLSLSLSTNHSQQTKPTAHRTRAAWGAGAEPLPFRLREQLTAGSLRASVSREESNGRHGKAERQGVEEHHDESPLHPKLLPVQHLQTPRKTTVMSGGGRGSGYPSGHFHSPQRREKGTASALVVRLSLSFAMTLSGAPTCLFGD